MSYLPLLPYLVLASHVVLFTLVPSMYCADPVYSPQTVSDASGNAADSASAVTWANLPDGEPFAASSPSRVSEGLKTYYDLMHSFIDSVFNKGIPVEIIESGIGQEFDTIISNKDKYIESFIGFGVCIAVGVLFLLLFPLIGCCFCCCRLCGNCGGKKQQRQKDADSVCKKYMFASILFIAIIFVLVGTICIYLNNDNMTTTLNSIPDMAEANINDMRTYVNNTVEEAKHIVTNNFQFVQTALFRDLDNIAYLVGLPLKTDIEDNTNISDVLTTAYGLADSLDSADAALAGIESNKTALETAISNLKTSLTGVTDNLDATFIACGGSCAGSQPNYDGAVPDIDTTAFPDLSSVRTSMDAALATNLTQEIVDAEDKLEDIPFRVDRDANSTTEGVKTTITDLSDTLDDVLNQITDVNKQISGENGTIDLDKLIDDIKDYKELVEQYDKYRWYVGVGLATICLFVAVFVLLGLTCGILGTSSSTPTHERGCVSNCGGIMLMVAAALIFLFSAWLMLLTFLTFIPGAPIHKVICEPLTDLDKLEEYVKIYNDQEVGAGKYFLGDALLSNDTIPITVTGILRDCRDGQSIFTALKLDNKFDLTDMLDYSKTLDVQSEIDGVNIDLSAVEIYTPDLQNQLTDLKDAVNISFTDFYTELGANITTANLSSLADEIDAYVVDNSITNPHDVNLKAEATKLRRIESEEYAYVESNVTALNTSVSEMEAAVANIPGQVADLELGLQTADNYVKNNGTDVVRSLLNTYVTRLLSIIDSFTSYTDTAVRTQMGGCEPIWNIYNSLLVYTFCYNFMDCFNGFWFSLGWVIFFFMPSVIFAVKLSKFFRRMNHPHVRLIDDTDDVQPHPMKGGMYPNEYPAKEQILRSPNMPANSHYTNMPAKSHYSRRSNKVAHKDSLDTCVPVPATLMPQCGPSDTICDNVPQHLYCDNSDISLGKITNNVQLTEVETSIPRQDRTEDMNATKHVENGNQNETIAEAGNEASTTETTNVEDYKPAENGIPSETTSKVDNDANATETTHVEDNKPIENGRPSETISEVDNDANATETTHVEDNKPVENRKQSETISDVDNDANTTDITDLEECKSVETRKQSEIISDVDNDANTTDTTDVEDCKPVENRKHSETIPKTDNDTNTIEATDVEDCVHVAYGKPRETIPDAVNNATTAPSITEEQTAN